MIYTHDISPIMLSLGPINLYWYGAMYVISFLLIENLMKKDTFCLNKNYLDAQQIDTILFTGLISLIIGGRIGYVIFYNLDYYMLNPQRVFFIWEGGMSFHGALIAVFLNLVWLSAKMQLSFLRLSDYLVVFVPIGLFLGRIGNFINAELYGKPTDGTWGVIFPNVDEQTRHPSMLYEAFLEGIVLFIILLFISKIQNYKIGFSTATFLIFYSIFRFIVEFVRVPDIQIGYIVSTWMTMGHILSLPMFFVGLLIYLSAMRSTKL